MRWFVDLTPLGGGTTEKLCLEAGEWQQALRLAREQKGHDAPIGQLSVEVMDDGYRAVDPTVRVAFLIRRAPDDAPIQDGSTPSKKRSSRQSLGPKTEAAGPPGRVADEPAPVAVPTPGYAATRASDPPVSGGGMPRATPPPAVTPLLSHEVLASRVVEPTSAQPIHYVEVALVLAEGGIEVAKTALEALLRARLASELAPLDGMTGVYVNVAVFGRAPSGKPMRRPLATLAFKDWAGEPVVEHFEVPMSTPTPSAPASLGYAPGGAPPVVQLPVAVAPAAASQPDSEVVTQRRPTPAPAVLPPVEAPPVEATRPASVPPPKPASVPPEAASAPAPRPASVPPARLASGPPPALPASAFLPIVPPAAPLPGVVEASGGAVDVDLDDERDTDLKERDTEISTQLSPQPDPPSDPSERRPAAPPSVDDDLVATQQRPRVDVAKYLSPKTEDLPPTRLTDEPPSTKLTQADGEHVADRAGPQVGPTPLAAVSPPLAAYAVEARGPSAPPTGLAADLAVLPPDVAAARQPPPPAPPPPGEDGGREAPPRTPTPSADLSSGTTPTPLLDRREKPEPATKLAGARRFAGDELISELFDACGELSFMATVGEALDYVVSILLEKLPCEVLVLSLYDIDKNEFVVVRQAGGRRVVQHRFKAGPTVRKCMKTSQVAVLSHSVELGMEARWQELGLPPRTLVLAPIEDQRRDLGLLELANPHDGKPLTVADGNALKYLGAQLGEFLADRGVSLDDESLAQGPESIPVAIKREVSPLSPKGGGGSKTSGGKTSGGKTSGGKTSGGKSASGPSSGAKRKR